MMIEVLVAMLTTGLPSELSAFHFDASFIRRLSAAMGHASSAVLICMRQMVGDRVLPELSVFGGFALQTTVHVLAEEGLPPRATPTALLA